MGDRANCIVHQNGFDRDQPPVWLYTHWTGYDLLKTVQRAIQRHERWNDDTYLTRIVFDTMSKGHQGDETGFGISTGPCDNSYNYVVVDPNKQEVRTENPDDRAVLQTWSFENFCDTTLPDEY